MKSKPYIYEEGKLVDFVNPPWGLNAQFEMQELLYEKGYDVNIVYRMGCDRKFHDAWQVERKDIPRLIEQLFRQRIAVEVQAEGRGKASINFVYDYHEKDIISAINRFWKNK